jgi:hypothetical protein
MNQPASLHLSSEQALQTLVEGFVLEHQAVMVLFTDASCRVADAVEPKLEHLARERFPRLHFTVVSRSDSPALTAQWGGACTGSSCSRGSVPRSSRGSARDAREQAASCGPVLSA